MKVSDDVSLFTPLILLIHWCYLLIIVLLKYPLKTMSFVKTLTKYKRNTAEWCYNLVFLSVTTEIGISSHG